MCYKQCRKVLKPLPPRSLHGDRGVFIVQLSSTVLGLVFNVNLVKALFSAGLLLVGITGCSSREENSISERIPPEERETVGVDVTDGP